MPAVAVQVHCPFCNAAQATSAGSSYTCDFCLQPFSVVEAQKEESRLLEEIKSWVQTKVGAAGGGGGMDASSRSFIFQQKILPDLRRDIDRSLEMVGPFTQFPLILPPVPLKRSEHAANPLLEQRSSILAFKNLRARLVSEQVSSFAVGPQEQAIIAELDTRLANAMSLSNVADAGAAQSAAGYAAAKRNLSVLSQDVSQALMGADGREVARAGFLGALRDRYAVLADLCGIGEQLTSPAPLSGSTLADEAEAAAAKLEQAAQGLESSGYASSDAMSAVIGTNQEAAACRTLARWLRSYGQLTSRTQTSFTSFVECVLPHVGGEQDSGDRQVDLLDSCVGVIRAVRGETAVGAIDDFGWIPAWAERTRSRKTMGFFGNEERVGATEQFLTPVWIADVSFSRTEGAVFKEGKEGHCLAILDACAPTPAKVVVMEGETPWMSSLASPRPLGGEAAGLPRSTAATVESVFLAALRGRPGFNQARVAVRELAFLPAAVIRFDSSKGAREQPVCMNGLVPIDAAARTQRQAAQELLNLFG